MTDFMLVNRDGSPVMNDGNARGMPPMDHTGRIIAVCPECVREHRVEPDDTVTLRIADLWPGGTVR